MKQPLTTIVLITCILLPALNLVATESGVLFSDRIEQAVTSSNTWMALIEIPMGSANKYELDEATGMIVLDRVMPMPVVYPVNYGMFPQTLAGDGDALDVLLLSRFPIHPRVVVAVRPVGILRMIDGGKQDDKILCVPVSKVDATFDLVHCITDLPPIELQRIENFFRVYKDLPEGRKKVELNGWGDAQEAQAILLEARNQWQERHSLAEQ